MSERAFHAGDAGSNPAGDVKDPAQLDGCAGSESDERGNNVPRSGPRVHAKRSAALMPVAYDPGWIVGREYGERAATCDALLTEVARLCSTDKRHSPVPVCPRFIPRLAAVPYSGCWLWTGAADSKGYGAISAWGRVRSTHRVAWTLFRGPIPVDMTVCHRCDVTLCCNPDHMFLGTHRENMRDMAAKGRAPAQKGRAA